MIVCHVCGTNNPDGTKFWRFVVASSFNSAQNRGSKYRVWSIRTCVLAERSTNQRQFKNKSTPVLTQQTSKCLKKTQVGRGKIKDIADPNFRSKPLCDSVSEIRIGLRAEAVRKDLFEKSTVEKQGVFISDSERREKVAEFKNDKRQERSTSLVSRCEAIRPRE